jgi:hypothetical protein
MRGLDPRIQPHRRRPISTRDFFVEVVPIRVALFDQGQLPYALPMLHRPLALYRDANVLRAFEIYEVVNLVFLGEALDEALLVLIDAPNQIVGHADLESAISAAREDVYIVEHTLREPESGCAGQARA